MLLLSLFSVLSLMKEEESNPAFSRSRADKCAAGNFDEEAREEEEDERERVELDLT